jgi:flagellar motor switch protein FliG
MAEAVGVEEEVIELTGTQKSAILMMLLGEDEAAEVLKNLSPREVQHLGTAMYSVATADQETVNSVLDEFLEIIKKQTSLGLGAGNYIRNVLQKALGDDKAQSVLSRITPASSERPIEILDWMDARSIAELVQDEHPQIVALIVSYLDFGLASDVLGLLDTQMQSEVIIRIATLEMVDPAALKELEKVMQSKFKANTSLRSSQVGGVKAAAKIMNFTKETMEKRILNDVKKADKDLMQAIQDNMFTFDNLAGVDNRAIQVLMRNIESDMLMTALKGADEEVRTKFLDNMSQRARIMFLDDMESKGPIRITDVEEAQKTIMRLARVLSDAGELVLAGRGDDFV